MSDPIAQARRFVSGAAIDAPPPLRCDTSRGVDDARGTAEIALQTGKQQASVVGAELLAFSPEVDATWRQDLLNSTLLAQLVAGHRVPEANRVFDWYDAYSSVLRQIGWVIEDGGFSTYVERGRDFVAHEAILKVAAGLLGPGSGSLALLTTALEALRSMQEDSPWLTLFERESCRAQTGRVQVGVVDQSPGGELSVSLVACGLEARTTMTQLLVFRSRASDVTLRHRDGRARINTAVLAGVREALRDKVLDHAREFILTLPDFGPPAVAPAAARAAA